MSCWQAPAICRLPSGPLFFNLWVKRFLLKHHIKLVNTFALISLHLLSLLPQDSLINHSWPWLNYFHGQIKKSKKYKQAITKNSGLVYHLLALGKFTQSAFPFYTSQIHGNNIFFFLKGLPTLIPRSHFQFLHFIYFQAEFSVLSSSSDDSTYFQIETHSYYNITITQFSVDTMMLPVY